MNSLLVIRRISFIFPILYFGLIPLTFPCVSALNKSQPGTMCFDPLWLGEFCLCSLGYHYIPDKDYCAPAIYIGGSCNKTEDCSYSGDKAICSNKTCACDSGYVFDGHDKQCVSIELLKQRNNSSTRKVNVGLKRCLENRTCPDIGSKCFNTSDGLICKCQSDYYLNLDSHPYCIKGVGFNESCSSSMECHHLDPFTVCSVRRICVCENGRHFNPDTKSCIAFPTSVILKGTRTVIRNESSNSSIVISGLIILFAIIGLGTLFAYHQGKFRNFPYSSQIDAPTNSPVAAFRRNSSSSVSYLIPSTGGGHIQTNMGRREAENEPNPIHHVNGALDNMK